MNSFVNLMNSFVSCPATSPAAAAAVLASSATDALKELFNPSDVLSLLALLFVTIATVLSIFELKEYLASATDESVALKLDKCEDDIQMSAINRARCNKRPSIDYSDSQKDVKSPKEVTPKTKSRRNSLPKSPFKTIELDVEIQEIQIPLPPNHERITLIEDEPMESEKKPFEWYLRWDLSDYELETLSYAEKARRFYHLTNYGEVQLQPETAEERRVEQSETCCEAVGFYHLPIKPPEEEKPINLITDVLNQTIDIPSHLMHLLKKNHHLTSSFLRNLPPRKEDLTITSMLRGRINYSTLVVAKKYFMTPVIKLPPKPKVAMVEKVKPGKPLTKEQLRNVLYIIGY